LLKFFKELTGHRTHRCPVFMKKRNFFYIFIVIFLFSLSFIPLHVLQLMALREGEIVSLHIVRPNDRFAIKYIHSVEHCPVWDFFVVDEMFRIVLYETTFSSCNTGLPCAPSGEEIFSHEKGYFRISKRHRVSPELHLWVDEKYDNTLKIGEHSLKLFSLAGNTLLKLNIRKVSLLEFVYLKVKYLK